MLAQIFSARRLRAAALFCLALGAIDAHAVGACTTMSVGQATALPNGTVGTPYTTSFSVSGGTSPYTWRVSSGLPSGSGLTIAGTGTTSTADLSGTPLKAGSFLVTVKATDANGCGGGRTYALNLAKGDQTISFTSTAPSNAQVGGATYTAIATATSGLPVTLSIDASAASVCSIAGSTVSFQSVGTCIVDANQAGNANYNAAPLAQQTFSVGKGDQTITFTSTPPASPTVGGPTYHVTATATSGLPVTFSIDAAATSFCTVSVDGTVSFIGAGTCVIDANQAGDTNWNAAPQATQSIVVGKQNQTITFTSTAPSNAKVGGATYTVAATASSGLTVTFSIDGTSTSGCSIVGNVVTFSAPVGSCIVDANQAGDTTYNPAPQMQQNITVAKGDQTISFTSTAPAAAVVGGATYNVTATATSLLPVTFTIDASAASVCSITGSTVSFLAVGTCVIDANQAGDGNWNAAPLAQQSFLVGKGSQTITFTSTAPAGATVGGPTYNVTATATSGLPVTFTIDASATSVCSISGSTVSFLTVGTCIIDANQAGDTNWNAAPLAQQNFGVAKGNQTISFTSTPPVNAQVALGSYTVTATATSGLTVTFTIDASAASVCSIAGSTVTFIGAGSCVIDANQAGNANYNAAPLAQQSFPVVKQNQTISFTSTAPSTAKNGGATYLVTATATSGLTVTFTSATTAVCTVSGGTVTFVGAGTCTINANQAGNGTYNAAPQVQQSFPVAKGDQTITFTSTPPAFGSATAAATPHTYTVTATASSGLTVTFTTSGTCSNVGGTVTFGPTAGTCLIFADQAGDTNWNPATQAQQSVTVEVPATAVGDSHSVTGNVAIQVPVGGSVLANDTGTTIVIKSFGVIGNEQTTLGSSTATTKGGTVTLNANGTYNYDPPSNYTGTAANADTFKYVIGNDLAATSTGTVTLNISDRIIVVSQTGSGNCKPVTPTPCSLTTADAAAAATGKDLVFVQSGSYNPAVFTMTPNQILAGNAVSLAQAISDAAITLAPDSVTIATINANTKPTLTNSATILTLSTNDLVEYFNINPSGGSAITASGSTSGTDTVHDVDVNGSSGATGVNLSSNSGGTFVFSNFTSATVNGTAFSATGGGTISVVAGSLPNKLAATGATALNVANTTIAAAGMTFLSIDSGSVSNSAANGIILDTTGTNGGVTVTGSGGAGSGGTIQHKTGADGSTTQGTGIFLNSTSKVALNNMQLNDFQNFAIRGSSVTGFSLTNSVISGSNGTTNAGGSEEGSIRFDNLNTSAAFPTAQITGSTISGGATFNLFLNNTVSGSVLNRLMITNNTFGLISATLGNDNVDILAQPSPATNTPTVKVTLDSNLFLGTRSDFFESIGDGNSTMDVVARQNKFQSGQAIIPGGGVGVSIRGDGGSTSTASTMTFEVSCNRVVSSPTLGYDTTAMFIAKGTANGTWSGTIVNNVIGAAKTNANADGIFVRAAGGGSIGVLEQGNSLSGYGNVGLHFQNNDGSVALTAGVFGNTLTGPNSQNFAGLFVDNGATATDTVKANVVVGSFGTAVQQNTLAGSGLGIDVSLSNFNAATTFNLYKNGSGSGTVTGVIQDDNVGNPSVDTSGGSGPIALNAGALPTLPPAPPACTTPP